MSDESTKCPNDDEVAALIEEGLPEELARMTFDELLAASVPVTASLVERMKAIVGDVRVDLDEPIEDDVDLDGE
jgi:hypothetical protein